MCPIFPLGNNRSRTRKRRRNSKQSASPRLKSPDCENPKNALVSVISPPIRVVAPVKVLATSKDSPVDNEQSLGIRTEDKSQFFNNSSVRPTAQISAKTAEVSKQTTNTAGKVIHRDNSASSRDINQSINRQKGIELNCGLSSTLQTTNSKPSSIQKNVPKDGVDELNEDANGMANMITTEAVIEIIPKSIDSQDGNTQITSSISESKVGTSNIESAVDAVVSSDERNTDNVVIDEITKLKEYVAKSECDDVNVVLMPLASRRIEAIELRKENPKTKGQCEKTCDDQAGIRINNDFVTVLQQISMEALAETADLESYASGRKLENYFDLDDDFADSFDIHSQINHDSVGTREDKNHSVTCRSHPTEAPSNETKRKVRLAELCRDIPSSVNREHVNSEPLFSEAILDESFTYSLIVDDVKITGQQTNNIRNYSDDVFESNEQENYMENLETCDMKIKEIVNNSGNENVLESQVDNSSYSSQNALDMNITQNSNDDMFNDSAGLIAASNYERVGQTESTGIENKESYNLPLRNGEIISPELCNTQQDNHVPYLSGQENCFQQVDNQMHVGNVNVKVCNILPVQDLDGKSKEKTKSGGVLGEFTSQTQSKDKDQYRNNGCDDVIEMGSSFSSTFSLTCIDSKQEKGNLEPTDIASQSLGDSLTMSMVEQAVSGNCEKSKNENVDIYSLRSLRKVNYDSAYISDNTSQDSGDMNNVNSNHNNKRNVKNIGNSIKPSASEEFITPKRPSKRLRATPGDKVASKVQKLSNSNIKIKPLRRPSQLGQTEKGSVNRRKRKSTEDGEVDTNRIVNVSPEVMNSSTGSDYVPPTPPDDTSSLPSAAGNETPKKAIQCRNLSATAFSPKLTKSAKSFNRNGSFGKSKQNNTPSKIRTNNNDHTKHIETSSRTSNKHETKHRRIVDTETPIVKSSKNVCSETEPGADELNADNKPDSNNVDECDDLEKCDNVDENAEVVDDNDDDDNRLCPSFIEPNEAVLSQTQQSFTIIDVCGDKRLFKTFIMEWRTKLEYSVSLACETLQKDTVTAGIGANFSKGMSQNIHELLTSGMISCGFVKRNDFQVHTFSWIL